jgi:hypothetical protein
MRPIVGNLIAVVGGVSASIIVVLGTLLAGYAPVVVLPSGSTEVVPGWTNTSSEYAGLPHFCSPHPCGYAGEVDLNFEAVDSVSLRGVLHSQEPIWVAVLTQGVGLCGYFTYPLPPCPSPAGTWYLYLLPQAATNISFSELQFNFTGSNNQLPPGAWSIVLVNVNSGPVQVTVVSSIVISPLPFAS